MTALPQALAPTQATARTAPLDREDGRISSDTDRDITAHSFEDAVREQADGRGGEIRPDDGTAETPANPGAANERPVPEANLTDLKADIIPIADPNGTESVRPEPANPAVAIADTALPSVGRVGPDGGEPPRTAPIEATAPATLMTPEGDQFTPDLRIPANGRVATPITDTPSVTNPTTATATTTPATATLTTANPASVPTPVAIDPVPQPGATQGPIAVTAGDETAVPVPRTTDPAVTEGRTSGPTPVTIGTAPTDGADGEPTPHPVAKADMTPIADVDGDIEHRATAKTTPVLVEPVKTGLETVRMSDLPSIQTLPNAAADTLATPKTLPLTPQVPTLTPIGGLGERLVANYIQTMPNPGPVTLDKLPQTVVALAMNSQSATLQIDPPELGRIQLEYQFDMQGRTVVTLIPESEAARAALADRMASISAALSQNASGEVDVQLGDANNFNFDQQFGGHDSRSNSASTPQADMSAAGTPGQADIPTLSFTRPPSGQMERLHILV